MHLAVPLQSLRAASLFSALILCALLAAGPVLAAPRVRLDNGALWLDAQRFRVRGVAYYGAPLGGRPRALMPVAPCLHARDLPLIAAMGANVVRTFGLLPEADDTFPAVLESTGLYWIAGFPFESLYDPEFPIAAQRGRILDAFRNYAWRFRGQSRLLAYAFGNDVVLPPADLYPLLADAAAILRQIEPESPPLLTTVATSLAGVSQRPPGLSFWCWNAGAPTDTQLAEIERRAALPVLFSEFDAGGDESAQTIALSRLTVGTESATRVLGAVYSGYAGGRHALFRAFPTREPGLDSLRPQPLFYAIAALWGGTYPPSWHETEGPHLDSLDDGTAASSAGALVRLAGAALLHTGPPYSDEAWPFHLGSTCLCVGGVPARLTFVSPTELSARIPSTLDPGELNAVFFRAGAASNLLPIHIRRFAAGTFAGPILEAHVNH